MIRQQDFVQKKANETQEPTFRTNNQTPPLLRTLINRLNNINQLLLILQHPIQLIVVSRAEITHHVFVAEEEHQRHGIVQFVHLFEIGDLVQVAHVDDGEVFDAVGDPVQHLVLSHAVRIPISSESDYHESFFFGQDRLVDLPAVRQVGEDDGAHGLEVCVEVTRVLFWRDK